MVNGNRYQIVTNIIRYVQVFHLRVKKKNYIYIYIYTHVYVMLIINIFEGNYDYKYVIIVGMENKRASRRKIFRKHDYIYLHLCKLRNGEKNKIILKKKKFFKLYRRSRLCRSACFGTEIRPPRPVKITMYIFIYFFFYFATENKNKQYVRKLNIGSA